MNGEKNMAATSLRLPDDINARLNALAQRTGRSKTFYILEAIREHIDDLEDLYESQQIIQLVREGKMKVYTSEEVEKMLELEN